MRLSVVFELLLVFLFLAFAAARVIDPTKGMQNIAKGNKKVTALRQGPPNRYCACTSRMCNCCRDFSLPVVPLKGPGCASIMYVQRDTMMVTMSFGDRVLSNTTISGKTPKPICMALPGGISQFCGRVYGISKKGEQFRACLGLELRALDDIEAALRVSCFKFGPKGVRLESAPPVPETGGKEPEEEEEDDYDLEDDDDDLIGFGVDDEDDAASSEDNEVDSDSVDYTGFSVLGEDILGTLFSDDSGSSAKKKKPSKKTAKPQPQIVVQKVTTTTKRPVLPNRRRSTVRPLASVTIRPLSSVRPLSSRPIINRITNRPALNTRPQAVQKPSEHIIVPQSTIQTAFLPGFPPIVQQHTNQIVKSQTTTEAPSTTARITTTTKSEENEKLQTTTEEISQDTTVAVDDPITFTVPSHEMDNVKNDISLPQTDLDKLEAVAAIAQQDVTSGVISSSALTSEETEKPVEIVTVKYEKVTPIYQTTPEKISSIKFAPTTVVTSRPSAELADDDSLEETAQTNSEPIRNKIYQQSTVPTEASKIDYLTVDSSSTKKENVTISFKKQPTKKPAKEEDDEEEEEEEEEAEEDLLEGVLSDDEETENDEAEEEEESPSETNKDDEQSDDEEAEEEESGEAAETSQKPTKVSIKKKPDSDDEEEEEEEEDILDVLSDDDEEEEEEESEDEEEPEKQKKKKKPTTEVTTIKIKKPTTHQVIQTRKPVTTPPTPVKVTTERVPENVFTYTQPPEKVTENVIIYQEPDNKIPNKIFVYKQPENQIQTTEKVIFYKEPSEQTFTEKYVIYKEPETGKKPVIVMPNDQKNNDETKNDSDEEEKIENNDDSNNSSSEEELEEDDAGKVVASIMKPGFSNKYAEEHDLTENDDLDIEDPEDDFEEERKMKENQKKPVTKPPPEKKPHSDVSKPKILTLSDLIGQQKKFHDHSKDDKPISTSRTHRRMNLDRLLQPK